MIVNLLAFILLGLASYRLTRFILHDSLIGTHMDSGTQLSVTLDSFGYNSDGTDRSFLRGKLTDLITCHYCISFWISCGLLAAWTWSWPWTVSSPQSWIITGFAISGVVALIYEWLDIQS